MKKGEGPDAGKIRLRQLKDKLETVGELLSEARLTAIIVLKCNTDDYQVVRLSTGKDPDNTLEQMEATLSNMFAIGIC